DEVEVVLALEALLHDLEMEKTEEPGAEAEAQRLRGLRLVDERGVVQTQLLHGVLQERVVLGIRGVEPGEHHRLRRPVTRQRRGRGSRREGKCVANSTVRDRLEAGRDVTGLPRLEARDGPRVGNKNAELEELALLLGREKSDAVARGQR